VTGPVVGAARIEVMADLTPLDASMTRATAEAGRQGEQAGAAYTRGRDGRLRDSEGKFVAENTRQGERGAAALAKQGEKAGLGFGQGITKTLNSFLGTNLSGSFWSKAVFAGLAVASVKMAGDFQQQMTRLVTAAGESKTAIAEVSAGVLQLARDTGTSTKDLASAGYMIESAGFHGRDALNIMRAAAEGAKVDMADTGVVANALTTAMTDMHAPTSQAATIMSQLVATVGHGKMTMDDLASSLHSVLPNAAALGLSMGETAGAIATMTAQGISAQQATQNLNFAILRLGNPLPSQTKAMALYGLNASNVARDLGKRGLAGTLDEVYHAIMTHMGPAGLTLTSVFNTSQIAADKANRMFQALPPNVQKFAGELTSGSISTRQFHRDILGLSDQQSLLARQWLTSYNRAHGFNDLLKSGAPDAQTFTAALASMTGGQTGLQVALHLTGANMATYRANIAAINAAHAEAGNHVRDWSEVQNNFNLQFARVKELFATTAITLGTALLPAVTAAARFIADDFAPAVHDTGEAIRNVTKWLSDNADTIGVVAGVIGAVLLPRLAAVAVGYATAGAAAVASAAETAVLWTMYKVEAVQAAAASVAASWRIAGGYVAVASAAVASAARTATAWLATQAQAARAAITTLAVGARLIIGYAATAAAAVAAAATQVGAWILLGTQSLIQAARVAAAWLIAMGPIGLVIAAVAGLVYIIIRNWDTIRRVTVQVFTAIVGFIRDHWRLLLIIFTGFFGLIVVLVIGHWRQIRAVFLAGVNAVVGFATRMWRDVTGFFTRLRNDTVAIVTGFVALTVGQFTSLWRLTTTIAASIWHGVVDFFGRMRDGVVAAFNGVVSAASSAWNRVKDVIAVPIRWVVENVYDQGIVGIWNGIAGVVGGPRLKEIHFAEGGVVPGSRSAGDNVPIFATAGEGVVNLRGMSILGPDGLAALNGASNIGGAGDHFAGGGLIDIAKRAAGAVGNAVGSAVSGLAGLVRGALGATVTPLIHAAESAADAGLGGMGPVGQMMDRLMHMLGDKIIQWVSGDDKKTVAAVVQAAGGTAAGPAQLYAASRLPLFGWAADQMPPLIALWNHESGWNANAVNQSSGAYGIPQALGHGHPYNLGDYAAQVDWGLQYIKERYGSPGAAWAFEMSHTPNWYDQGGLLQPGYTVAYNGTGRAEHVLTDEQRNKLSGGNHQVNVYPRAGQSEYEIGVIAARELAWAARMP